MKRFVTLLAIIAILFAITPTSAQQLDAPEVTAETYPYIVVMADKPVIAYDGGIEGIPATKVEKGKKINKADANVQRYESYLVERHNQVLMAAGVNPSQKVYDYKYGASGFAAIITEAQAKKIEKQPDVLMVQKDYLHQKQTDNSPSFLELDAPNGPWDLGYDGEGVIVGVIDTGIWPEHPSFADDGTYPAPPITVSECNFGNTAWNPLDVAFTCNNKLIGAREVLTIYKEYTGLTPREFDSARDDDGHGTHTSSTAAGNAGVPATVLGIPRGTVSGIAPRAHIVMYKALGELGGYGSDLAEAIDLAMSDGVDVINYSIGSPTPSLDGIDDYYFFWAEYYDVFIATSAGNSGPGAGTIGSPASDPWVTTVGASTQDRTFEGSVSLDEAPLRPESPDNGGIIYYGASITDNTDGWYPLIDAADVGNELCDPSTPFTTTITDTIVLCKRGDLARVSKSEAVYNAGGAGMILYNAVPNDSLNTDNHWVPGLHVTYEDGLLIKDYIANASNPTAYINGGVFTRIPAPWMASFSSRGPDLAAEDIIKPDVTAPGVNILAGNTPVEPLGSPGELFQSIGGTSMSSPHVAGIFALMKQAYPDWPPSVAKSALMTFAEPNMPKEDGITPADPFDVGAGHVRPGGDWDDLEVQSIVNPGLVYYADIFDYSAFYCASGLGYLSAVDCSVLTSLGYPTDAPYDLNYPSIGVASVPGSRTITRYLDVLADNDGDPITYYADVEPPPGFDVTVTPSEITVVAGDYISYTVTFENNGTAVLNEWAFGSLTWRSLRPDPVASPESPDLYNRFNVRSPIAVRATKLEYEDEVYSTGYTGVMSTTVGFGYTGVYTATAHGMAPDIIYHDTVVQDPDSSFNPGDGYSTLIMVPVQDAVYARFALPPDSVSDPANIDLDLYVYNPDGSPAGASGNGGTDEVVNIDHPMDGNFYVFIHGWAVPGGSTEFDLHTWAVPDAATTISIDSIPPSATLGASGDVTFSWGFLLPPAPSYLGAITHADDTGELGMTIVNINLPTGGIFGYLPFVSK